MILMKMIVDLNWVSMKFGCVSCREKADSVIYAIGSSNWAQDGWH